MSKIDTIAKSFEAAVREAFLYVYGPPSSPEKLESIRSTWSEKGIKQGWHDPDPGVVLVGTEHAWIGDFVTDAKERSKWDEVLTLLRHFGWDDVAYESINPAVQMIYWMPPKAWRDILMKRALGR